MCDTEEASIELQEKAADEVVEECRKKCHYWGKQLFIFSQNHKSNSKLHLLWNFLTQNRRSDYS